MNASLNERLAAIDGEIEKLEREIANVLAFVREGNRSKSLSDDLARLEEKRAALERERMCEQGRKAEKISLPSAEELKALARAKFQNLALTSYEFAAELRRFTPRIVVFPHQLIDGGQLVLRAKFRLQLAELIPHRATREAVQPMLEHVMSVDLFKSRQREAFRAAVVEGRKTATEDVVAKKLGITVTAAQNAMALQRLMDAAEVTDPYQPVIEPPEQGRLKRHRHSRYNFEPLPDAGVV
jgi:hypothetical protein